MKIWLDDVREPPDETWNWVRGSQAAIALLQSPRESVTEISLDHDLGLLADCRQDTGLCVARFIVTMKNPPALVHIHSMNPVGAAAMRAALEQRGEGGDAD